MAVVMAGGKATRFGRRIEKALLEVGNQSLIMRAHDALMLKEVDEVSVAVSPHTPRTREEAERLGFGIIDTPGKGYHQDVIHILKDHDAFLTVNVDVPFVKRGHVKKLLEGFDGRSVAAVVDAEAARAAQDKESEGTTEEGVRFIWVGLNVVTSDPNTGLMLFDDSLLAFNINDADDLARANAIALERGI